MTKYAVFGAGMMGRVAAEDLLDSETDASVVIFDHRADLLTDVATAVQSPRLTTEVLDVTAGRPVVEAMKAADVAVAALPHRLSLGVVESAIEAKTSLVDLVGSGPELRRALDASAQAAGCLVIPGCGVAPGISNFCVGEAMRRLDETHVVAIYVGGVPRRPKPPLLYETVYLLESVLSAYRRPATIVSGGKPIQVAPMTGLEVLTFAQPIGDLEAFYTDGLASLPVTVGDRVLNDMFEKTLRYPGHVAGIRLLEQCGLLSTTPVAVGDVSVAPVSVLQQALAGKLELGPEGDILAMRICVEGVAEGRRSTHEFEVIDFFDADKGHTAMARTTSFTAAIAARQIAAGELVGGGVRFPEEVFVGEAFGTMVGALAARGIRVEHRTWEHAG